MVTKVKEVFIDDLTTLSVDVINLVEAWAEKHGIVLGDDEKDTIINQLEGVLWKHTNGTYNNYN